MADNDIGYYTLPVILSFDGIEKKVNSQLSKAFGDVGKKSSKALADATEADVERAAKAYGKLRDRAEDALGKVRVEEEKLAKARAGGKQEQIVAAEERLNKARRDSSRATREAADSFKEYEDAQKRLGDGARGLGDRFGGLGDMAGKAGQALTTAGVVAAGAALAGITALGGGVIILGRQLYDLGAQWDDVTDSIAVRTGKLGPELEKLTEAVKDIAPSTASSITQIGAVVGAVSQNLRISGMDLDLVSQTIANLNRLTGEDLNVRELGKAFRGFGVDAKQQIPTLDALYRASTATGMSVNELVAAVVSAGSGARTMGLDLSQTAALLATFNDAGLDGQKAMAALSLAAKNLAKDGIAPAAGLRDTLTQIEAFLAAGDDPRAINLATKIFGRGYAPILDAIRSGALDAQSLNDALAQSGPTINEVADATADWSERWQQLKNTLSVALEPIATGVFTMINERLDGLADWVTNNQSKVIGFFGSVADWAFNAAKAVVGFVADSLRAIGELIGDVAPALGDIGDAISWIPGLGKAGDALMNLERTMATWPNNFNRAADAIENNLNGALQKGQDYTKAFIERTKQATRFSEVLGETVAKVNDNGDIILSDNTPEVEQKLKDLGITVTELPDGTFTVTADTDEANQILGDYRDQETGKPIELEVKPDTGPADAVLEDWKRKVSAGSVEIPITGGLLGVPVPGPGAGGITNGPLGVPGPQKFAAGRSRGPESGLTENSIAAKRAIESTFPAIQSIGGYRPPDVTPFGTFTEHSSGEAIDVMVPGWNTPAGKAYGDRIAQWALANADSLGTEWVIWQQKTYYPDGRVSGMPDRGDPTQNHYDHVHLKTKRGAVPSSMRRFSANRGGGAAMSMQNALPMSADPGGALNIQEPMPAEAGYTATMSSAIDTSRLYSASPNLVNAYGADYEPGIGIPGSNEYGEPGYYRQDPKRVRDAQQAVADADEAIRQADAAVAQAQARVEELPFDAPESSTLSANESLRAAKARADKVRRERLDKQADYEETLKGEFTSAKQAAKSKTGGRGGGGMGLGGLGSIASSFLQETFGIGSWLPALDDLMPLQIADTLLGTFLGPMLQGSEQTAALPAGGAAGTSPGPFGIPDIAAPPMPTGGMHGGSGAAPGPAPIINVDNSQNFNNSPLGWDPVQVNKQRDNNIMRAPRLPVGMGG